MINKKINDLIQHPNDFIIILGAVPEEKHIIEFKQICSREIVITMDARETDKQEYANAHIVMDFNSVNLWRKFEIFENRVNSVIIDYSVFKFTDFDEEILRIIHKILKKGGSFYTYYDYACFVGHYKPVVGKVTDNNWKNVRLNLIDIDTYDPRLIKYLELFEYEILETEFGNVPRFVDNLAYMEYLQQLSKLIQDVYNECIFSIKLHNDINNQILPLFTRLWTRYTINQLKSFDFNVEDKYTFENYPLQHPYNKNNCMWIKSTK